MVDFLRGCLISACYIALAFGFFLASDNFDETRPEGRVPVVGAIVRFMGLPRRVNLYACILLMLLAFMTFAAAFAGLPFIYLLSGSFGFIVLLVVIVVLCMIL